MLLTGCVLSQLLTGWLTVFTAVDWLAVFSLLLTGWLCVFTVVDWLAVLTAVD